MLHYLMVLKFLGLVQIEYTSGRDGNLWHSLVFNGTDAQ